MKKNVKRLFAIINRNLFQIDSKMSYDRLQDCILKLCESIMLTDDDVDLWDIGEFEDCDLLDFITGAYWHFTDWHSGQFSKEYLCLSQLGMIYSPNMETSDSDNIAFIMLDDMANPYIQTANKEI